MPRILAAVVVAVSLHGVLLLGGGTGGASSATQRSQSLAVRFIESSARPTAISAIEPSVFALTAGAVAPETGPRPTRDPPPPVEGATGKPTPPTRAMESPMTSGSALAPTPPEASAVRPGPALGDARDYLMAGLLSVGPRPLDDIEPLYPDAADQRSGKVVLRLLIGDTGHVDDVAVVRASPPGLFDASAIEAFSKARFSPGLAGGIAVKSQITVEVEFVPLNRLSRISGRSY